MTESDELSMADKTNEELSDKLRQLVIFSNHTSQRVPELSIDLTTHTQYIALSKLEEKKMYSNFP